MRLSEAIRLGAMMKPQGFGRTFGDRTCALGASLEAVGATDTGDWMPVYNIFPIARKYATHPLVGYQSMVGHACWVLNDTHRWTREQIADWVEGIERAQEPVIATAQSDAIETASSIRSEAPEESFVHVAKGTR